MRVEDVCANVAAAAVDEPETAANAVPAPTEAMAVPPGIRPTSALAASKTESKRPDISISCAIRINSGTADRELERTAANGEVSMVAMASSTPPRAIRPTVAVPKMAKLTGTRRIISATSSRTIVSASMV